MAKRITITVPIDLHNRLQLVKSNLNISKACQDELEFAVARSEFKQTAAQSQGAEKRSAFVQRLKLERDQGSINDRRLGLTDGITISTDLPYATLLLIESCTIEAGLLSKLPEKISKPLASASSAYKEGWREGVISVWNQLKVLL